MKLSELNVGETATVAAINGEQSLVSRLETLGIVKGGKVTLIRVAPFGDPLEIKVRDFYLAIRVRTADKITVVL